MAVISESFPGRRDGNYTIIFGDEDLGSIISAVHATSIKLGTELEHLIVAYANVIDRQMLDQFFNKTLKPGIYIIPKSTMSDRRLKFDQKPDLLVVNVDQNTCKIIEVKLGDAFDTKKSQGEVDNLTAYADKLNRATTYRVSWAVCFWFAPDKAAVINGFKGTITANQALTGAEFCEMVHIDYHNINMQISMHQQANREFLFGKISEISKKYAVKP